MTARNSKVALLARRQSAKTSLGGYEQRPSLEVRALRVVQRVVKRRAQKLLWHGIGAMGYAVRRRGALPPVPGSGDPRVRRILLVRVDLLGDTVLTTPAIAALRRGFPQAKIDMLVQRSTAEVLAAEREIAQVITFDPQILQQRGRWMNALKLVRRLRKARYDIAISVAGDLGSIFTRLSGAKCTIGYAGEAYPHMLTHPVPGGRYAVAQHETQYVLALAEAAGGITHNTDARPRLRVAPDAQREMAAMLRLSRAQLGRTGPIIAMHAGARNGQAKRWPSRHFAALADLLAEELDALVVVTGAPNEATIAQHIVRQASHPLINVSGKTSLPQLTAILAQSNVLVTGDSGPMHIACAVDTPVVVMHGPTDPALSGPTAPDAIVLRHHLWCSPCYDASATAECRFGNPICMKAITPRTVLAAVRRQLLAHGWAALRSIGDENQLSVSSLP